MRSKDLKLGGVPSFPSTATLDMVVLLRKALAENEYPPATRRQFSELVEYTVAALQASLLRAATLLEKLRAKIEVFDEV